ncbi:MAG: pantetheine-phosphate adenylyltransferase, partial [Methanomassiliicoccales archaeon]|nr:pantetheine-phosphate adenylyltransferase [Methanomassiliicoccales archaeon]
MKVGVGGTFNVLHRGHRALLDKAFEVGDEVVVGITSDEFTAKKKTKQVPLQERMKALESYLDQKGKAYSVNVIESSQARLLTDDSIEALVASPETYTEADRLAKLRLEKGMRPLRVIRIGYILADDCTPISASRVLSGEIDESGKMLRPMRIGVGSDNPVKLNAVRNVMIRIYSDVVVSPAKARTSVPAEPWGDEVEKGAMERARGSLGQFDFGVGIEAGIFEHNGGLYDVQFCAVLDRMNRFTLGHGLGFRYPPNVEDRLREGKSVGRIFHELYGQE